MEIQKKLAQIISDLKENGEQDIANHLDDISNQLPPTEDTATLDSNDHDLENEQPNQFNSHLTPEQESQALTITNPQENNIDYVNNMNNINVINIEDSIILDIMDIYNANGKIEKLADGNGAETFAKSIAYLLDKIFPTSE